MDNKPVDLDDDDLDLVRGGTSTAADAKLVQQSSDAIAILGQLMAIVQEDAPSAYKGRPVPPSGPGSAAGGSHAPTREEAGKETVGSSTSGSSVHAHVEAAFGQIGQILSAVNAMVGSVAMASHQSSGSVVAIAHLQALFEQAQADPASFSPQQAAALGQVSQLLAGLAPSAVGKP